MATTTWNGKFVSGEIDLICPNCGAFESKRFFDFSKSLDGKNGILEKEASLDAAYDGILIDCPSCETTMEIHTPNEAPAGHMKRDYDSEVSAMQSSFRHRFMKKELDDVRHKFGSLIDDSLVAGEARRIREKMNK